MKHEYQIVTKWHEEAGIEVIESNKHSEEYVRNGKSNDPDDFSRIINHTFAFVVNGTREQFEDFENEKSELSVFMAWFEMLYILEKVNAVEMPAIFIEDTKTHWTHIDNIIGILTKKQGEEVKCLSRWKEYMHKKRVRDTDILWEDTGYDVSVDIVKASVRLAIPKGFKPIFQRRRNWTVIYGDFCKRCGQEGSSDFRAKISARFEFGFIPEDAVKTDV